MYTTLNQINEQFNDETYPIFPFISKNRITILPAGLYRKHKASFRGVTARYNSKENKYEFPLYGMYNITENLIIVPPDMVMTPSKAALLKAKLEEGFVQVPSAPKFETLYYPEDSKEAELALANKLEHQTRTKLEHSPTSVPHTPPEDTEADVMELMNNFNK